MHGWEAIGIVMLLDIEELTLFIVQGGMLKLIFCP